MSGTHPLKHEVFDTAMRTNTDPKGFVRMVDSYELITPECLYMRRGMDHRKFGYLESFLLPRLGLRANIFHFRDEVATEHLRYLDIVDITCPTDPTASEPGTWETLDVYLDILQLPDGSIVVDDTDELTAAIAEGLVTPDRATRALDNAFAAIAGICDYGGDVDSWLRSCGYPISWATNVELMPIEGKTTK